MMLIDYLQIKNGRGGEFSPKELNYLQQDEIFSLIERLSQQRVYRTRDLSDIEAYRANILYKKYANNPELAKFCEHYSIPEPVFIRALDLLKKPKQSDLLPDIYLNGKNDVGCPGYHFFKLPANDYHAFFLGYNVNNCQSLGRTGEQIVLDAWNYTDRGFYVLVKEPIVSLPRDRF